MKDDVAVYVNSPPLIDLEEPSADFNSTDTDSLSRSETPPTDCYHEYDTAEQTPSAGRGHSQSCTRSAYQPTTASAYTPKMDSEAIYMNAYVERTLPVYQNADVSIQVSESSDGASAVVPVYGNASVFLSLSREQNNMSSEASAVPESRPSLIRPASTVSNLSAGSFHTARSRSDSGDSVSSVSQAPPTVSQEDTSKMTTKNTALHNGEVFANPVTHLVTSEVSLEADFKMSAESATSELLHTGDRVSRRPHLYEQVPDETSASPVSSETSDGSLQQLSVGHRSNKPSVKVLGNLPKNNSTGSLAVKAKPWDLSYEDSHAPSSDRAFNWLNDAVSKFSLDAEGSSGDSICLVTGRPVDRNYVLRFNPSQAANTLTKKIPASVSSTLEKTQRTLERRVSSRLSQLDYNEFDMERPRSQPDFRSEAFEVPTATSSLSSASTATIEKQKVNASLLNKKPRPVSLVTTAEIVQPISNQFTSASSVSDGGWLSSVPCHYTNQTNAVRIAHEAKAKVELRPHSLIVEPSSSLPTDMRVGSECSTTPGLPPRMPIKSGGSSPHGGQHLLDSLPNIELLKKRDPFDTSVTQLPAFVDKSLHASITMAAMPTPAPVQQRIEPMVQNGVQVSSTHYFLIPPKPEKKETNPEYLNLETMPKRPQAAEVKPFLIDVSENSKQSSTAQWVSLTGFKPVMPVSTQQRLSGSHPNIHSVSQYPPTAQVYPHHVQPVQSLLPAKQTSPALQQPLIPSKEVTPTMHLPDRQPIRQTSLQEPLLPTRLGLPQPVKYQGSVVQTQQKTPQDLLNEVGKRVHGVTTEECHAALLHSQWHVEEAVKYLKVEQLFRLGITSRGHCERLLKTLRWNLELAGEVLLDEVANNNKY